MINKDYERMITIIKPNDVLYSRDLHAIDIMNKIILDREFNIDLKDKLFLLVDKVLKENDIKYSIHPDYNAFMIQEDSWEDIIYKKKGNFIFKEFYQTLKENNLEKLIYETKLNFINKAQMENLELNKNTIILNSNYIDDIKLLESNGVKFNSKEHVISEDKYLDFLIKSVTFHDSVVYLYLNVFSSSIDDLIELYNLIKDNTYLKTLLKNIKISTMFITFNKYNESKMEEYNKLNVPSYGLIKIFDQSLITRIKSNKNM